MARLAGVSTQGIFHLKQAMGGGKTPCSSASACWRSIPSCAKYCGGLPYAQAFEVADIAAFNGRNNPVLLLGRDCQSAWQRRAISSLLDQRSQGPRRTSWLKLLTASTPILILLDEMPPYFHYLDTQKVGNGTVADIATRAFANLITAAGKKSNVCVVVSDLAASYDTGTGLINRALEDARAELGRQERITPVDLAANEIYDILRKRLFTSLPDKAVISDIAASYGRKLEEASKSKVASRGAEAIADRNRHLSVPSRA